MRYHSPILCTSVRQITFGATSAALELRILNFAVVLVRGRDCDRNGNGRLQPEIDERLGRNLDLLPARCGIHTRARCGAGQTANGFPLSTACKSPNDCAQGRAAACLLSSVLAATFAFLTEGVGHEGDVLAARSEFSEFDAH